MYNPYLLSFKLLHAIGLKKTSVRLARHMEKYARQPLENSKLYDAVWMFFTYGQSFPPCQTSDGYGNCHTPVLSDDDPFHEYCRQTQAEYAARIAAEEAEANAWYDSRCQQAGCWEDAVKDGYCQSDWDYNHLCGCGELWSECSGTCNPDIIDEPGEMPYDVLLDDDDDSEDPLAGDIDDGSNYVGGPNPLTTQHFHALRERGLL